MSNSHAMYRNVLFVAPDDKGLNSIPELDAIADLGFEARVLQGKVTDNRLFEAVRRGKHDILHWAGHGNAEGVALSDGSMLDYDQLKQVALQAGARVVFLNSCNSAPLVQRLVNDGIPTGIGTFDDVPDQTAKLTGMTFYKWLATTQDAHRAYRQGCSDAYYGWYRNGSESDAIREIKQELVRVYIIIGTLMAGEGGLLLWHVLGGR